MAIYGVLRLTDEGDNMSVDDIGVTRLALTKTVSYSTQPMVDRERYSDSLEYDLILQRGELGHTIVRR